MLDEAFVVELQKPRQRAACRGIQMRRGEYSPHEYGRALTHHCGHLVVSHRHATQLSHERISRVGKVPAGIDERAVEIKDAKTSQGEQHS